MTDAVFVTSPDGVIRMANQSACKLLAWGEDELVGRGIVSILDESRRRSCSADRQGVTCPGS
jgi:PAS domain S-box-containing protein